RTGDVQLDRGDALVIGKYSRHLDVLVECRPADIDEYRRPAGAQFRELFVDEPAHTDPLQTDRVQHAGGRLDDPLWRMAFALLQEQSLDDEAAERGQVDDIGVF